MTLSKASISTLLPKSYLEELIQIRDNMTNSYWRIGDIVNSIAMFSISNRFPADKMRIYIAVGSVVGKTARSVRLYATTSNFFSPEVRQKYEVLPYCHFVLASQFQGGVKWQEDLESAMDFIDQFGYPPSLERLHSLMQGAPIIINPPTVNPEPIQEPIPDQIFSQSPLTELAPKIFTSRSEISAIIHRLPILVGNLLAEQDTPSVRCAELLAQIYTIAQEIEDIIYGKTTIQSNDNP